MFINKIYQTDDMTLSEISSSELGTLEKLLTGQINSTYSNSLNFVNNYIEEVATIGEIIEKMIKRYIKKNNWSVNRESPLSAGI